MRANIVFVQWSFNHSISITIGVDEKFPSPILEIWYKV